ncbi:Protein of unknown function [Pyronema omphalodes CBS 100304]|uniref:Uncharacterized protein n=1 Tax=Pyronema omphalodes (strain CBS 100304) TaxID=1076935 RepID=U4L126_PYROM|nr:Protein of unknown function [Pyronema omphalodes CBS 100304]
MPSDRSHLAPGCPKGLPRTILAVRQQIQDVSDELDTVITNLERTRRLSDVNLEYLHPNLPEYDSPEPSLTRRFRRQDRSSGNRLEYRRRPSSVDLEYLHPNLPEYDSPEPSPTRRSRRRDGNRLEYPRRPSSVNLEYLHPNLPERDRNKRTRTRPEIDKNTGLLDG